MWARTSHAVLWWSVAGGLVLADAGRTQEPGAWQTVLRATLPLAKRDFLTEPLRAAPDEQLRVVLSGTFHFAHNDRSYDALYTSDASGRFTERHEYLVFSPQALPVVAQDPLRHRYVFEVPAALAGSGQSLGVGLDLPRMVRDFLLTPNEVVGQLSGRMEIELQRRAVPPGGEGATGASPNVERARSTSTAHFWIAALVLAACAGTIWYCRRSAGFSQPLRQQLQRIRARHTEAQSLLGRDGVRFGAVAEEVAQLQSGAWALARQMQRFERLQNGLEVEGLEREIAELEKQQRGAEREDVQQEIGSTLAEKRRLLGALGDTRARHARYALRLSKIEAVLESTRLSIPELDALEEELVAPHGSGRQQQVLDRIQSEMRAVEEALHELDYP